MCGLSLVELARIDGASRRRLHLLCWLSLLHARHIALMAGGVGDEVDRIARQMADEKDVRADRALVLLKAMRGE